MRKFRATKSPAPPPVQLRETASLSLLQSVSPQPELRLYRAMREQIPLLDTAVSKIIRMVGGVTVCCEHPLVEQQLRLFLRTVNTGRGQQGIEGFLCSYLDSMLVSGRAIGEIVLSPNRRDIAAILCGNPEDIQIQEKDSPLDFVLCGRDERGSFSPLPYQNLLLFTPFRPEAAHPYGVSLFRSLPFVTNILLQIYQTIGTNWERCGNARFAVVYRPKEGEVEQGLAQERVNQLAQEWSRAMQLTRNGAVRDFVAVGDVEIRVIGADNLVLDSEVPVRQMLEQIVACTGIPPFLLGLSWSSTERMSAQQADLLTTEMTAIRRSLEPILERICSLWMKCTGNEVPFSIQWDAINLQDLLEEAQANLYHQQALKLQLENQSKQQEASYGNS